VKGFPATADGAAGSPMQAVNAAIAKAKNAASETEVRATLGEPDEVIAVPEDERRRDEDGAVEPRYPARILVYHDPYRPRIRYRFGVTDGRIVEYSKTFLPG